MFRTLLKPASRRGRRSRRADSRVLTLAQWRALMADPATIGPLHLGGDRRTQARFRHREVLHLFVGVGLLREPRERYLVRTRDVSPHGVGFVHSREMKRGTRCRVGLLTRRGELVRRTGTVASCAARADGLFNVGLVLDAELALREVSVAARAAG